MWGREPGGGMVWTEVREALVKDTFATWYDSLWKDEIRLSKLETYRNFKKDLQELEQYLNKYKGDKRLNLAMWRMGVTPLNMELGR